MPISDAPAGPTAQLASALQSLHALKGAPSVRTLARQVGDVSHTTVADALAGRRVPSWPVLEGIVRVLGGEQERFKQLWLDARAAAAVRSRAAAAATAGYQDDDFVDRYVRQVISDTDWLELQEPGATSRVAFDELYIPQRVVAASSRNELFMWKLDDQLRRVVLLGDPGIGTSTACRALMRRHAFERSREVPFLIQVREFAATIPPARSVVGHVEHTAEAFFQVRPPERALARLLSAGRALVIFDGLAEVTVTAAKATVSIIELFCREFPEARVLVTARSADAQARLDPGLFAEYRLAGFAGNQVTDYVRRWFALAPNVPDKHRQRLARAFLAESALIPNMAVNPLRLRLACQAYARDGILPAGLISADPGDQSAAGRPHSRTSVAQARILFVEDEPDWLDVISRALPDYEVDMASSYGQALELLHAGEFYDVALVDLNLMDSGEFDSRDQLGGEVLRLLRDNYPATRRIAMTGWPPSSVRTIFESFDVDDLLLKQNMTLSDVRHGIEQALALARSQHNVPSDTQSRELGAE